VLNLESINWLEMFHYLVVLEVFFSLFAYCQVCEPACGLGKYCQGTVCVDVGTGQYSAADSNTVECNSGYYDTSATGSAINCIPCAEGYSTPSVGATEITQCNVCAPGYYGAPTTANSAGCVECEVGYYKWQIGNADSCTSCNHGYTTSLRGSTHSNECDICGISYYGGVTSNDSTGCTRCQRGYSTSSTGQTTSNDCNICDYGYFGDGDIYDGQGCTRCSNGYSTASQNADDADQCTLCGTGFQVVNNICAVDNSALTAITGGETL
jgi:hypothetical protein